MIDNYSHDDTSIIYIVENIPGPIEQNQDYEDVADNFNSQLINYCMCKDKCSPDTCKCLQISGGANYSSYLSNENKIVLHKLDRQKDMNIHPVFECNDFCKCSELCGNRVVQKGPIQTLHVKHTENKSKGLGLYTHTLIRKGSFVCEYAGEVITKSQAQFRHQFNTLQGKMNYILCLNEHVGERIIQTFVDPSNFGNIGRYINHSCDPNSEIVPVRINSPLVKLAVFSVVDIAADTEITFDYGANDINYPNSVDSSRKLCFCSSINCKKILPYLPF